MAKAKKVQGAKATRAQKPKAGTARRVAASGVTPESLTLDLAGERDLGTNSKVPFRLFRFDTFAERITHAAMRDPKSGAWEYVAVDDEQGEAVAGVLSSELWPSMGKLVAACSGNGVTDEKPSTFSPHFVGETWAGRNDPLSDCAQKSRGDFAKGWCRIWDLAKAKDDAATVASVMDPRGSGSGSTPFVGSAFAFVCDLVSYPRIDYWMKDLHLKLAVGCMTRDEIFDPIFENTLNRFRATVDWFGRRTGCRAEAQEVIACVGTVVKWLEEESSLSEDAFRKLRWRVFNCSEAMQKMAGAVLSKYDAAKATEDKPGGMAKDQDAIATESKPGKAKGKREVLLTGITGVDVDPQMNRAIHTRFDEFWNNPLNGEKDPHKPGGRVRVFLQECGNERIVRRKVDREEKDLTVYECCRGDLGQLKKMIEAGRKGNSRNGDRKKTGRK